MTLRVTGLEGRAAAIAAELTILAALLLLLSIWIALLSKDERQRYLQWLRGRDRRHWQIVITALIMVLGGAALTEQSSGTYLGFLRWYAATTVAGSLALGGWFLWQRAHFSPDEHEQLSKERTGHKTNDVDVRFRRSVWIGIAIGALAVALSQMVFPPPR